MNKAVLAAIALVIASSVHEPGILDRIPWVDHFEGIDLYVNARVMTIKE